MTDSIFFLWNFPTPVWNIASWNFTNALEIYDVIIKEVEPSYWR
jgi:hypothetical protein